MDSAVQNPPVFLVKNLHCGYAGNTVVRGLDWILEPGDSFAILGPSGEGKSLFLKTLAGLAPYKRGSIEFFGKQINTMSSRDRRQFRASIGMTFQKDGLFDSLTCADNLRFPLRERFKMTHKELEKKVSQSLAEVGLGGQGKLFVHEMSGGMQKRLGIARALLLSPQVILYDEPAAGLDPITSRSINELIVEMRDLQKMTVVLVTSDLAQAQQVCRRQGLIWNGRFEQLGDWKSMVNSKNPVVHQFFHALPEGPLTAGLGR